MQRSGTVFLFILMVMGVLFALALGVMRSSALASTSAFESEPQFLADQAAQEGLAHAISTIHEDFADPDSVGVPTQFTDDWRQEFWPIDTHYYYTTFPEEKDSSRGKEMSAGDIFENDVHVENLLNELYCLNKGFHQAYEYRRRIYSRGASTHPGTGRWFEPGVTASGSTPISFHLTWPGALSQHADDPAPAVGVADYDDSQAIRYDGDLRPTNKVDLMRYRLRYAVAVEPIDGHILSTVPGLYDETARNGDLLESNEVDSDRAARYAPAFAEIAKVSLLEDNGGADPANQAYLAFQGLGYSVDSDESDWTRHGPPIAGVDTSTTPATILRHELFHAAPQIGYQDTDGDGLPETEEHNTDRGLDPGLAANAPNHSVSWELVGPIPSYKSFAAREWKNLSYEEFGFYYRYYLFQPFGMAPRDTSAPSLWHEGYTDTPWRVNVPVMAPKSWAGMLWAYMPQEFKVGFRNRTPSYDADGQVVGYTYHTRGDGTSGIRQTIESRNLFDEMESLAYFSDLGGITGLIDTHYPGTIWNPQNSNDWKGSEGGQIFTSEAESVGGMNLYHLDSSAGYGVNLFSDREDAAGVVDRVVEGTGSNLSRGFWNKESYWIDIAAAFSAAMGVAGYTWMDHTNGKGEPAEPAHQGQPFWHSVPSDYFEPADAPDFTGDVTGAACRDRLVSAGAALVPSAFDTVRELDLQFLRNLGEFPRHYATGQRPPLVGDTTWEDHPRPLYMNRTASSARRIRELGNNFSLSIDMSAADPDGEGSEQWNNSRSIKHYIMEDAGGNVYGTYQLTTDNERIRQAALMELVLNDFRMSFFGASPQYVDATGTYSFRPMDFDDDGVVRCSAYLAGNRAAVAFTDAYGNSVHGGPIPDPTIGDKIFSLTGYFTFQKSRYYRIFVRGEVFDELRQVPIAQSNNETVYVVDPDGDMWDIHNQPTGSVTTGLSDSHVLFQRKLQNVYRGTMSQAAR